MSDLGYFKDYGYLIISIIALSYLSFYVYLSRDYGPIDE